MHAVAAPFLLPAFTACALVFLDGHLRLQRAVSLGSAAVLLALCVSLAWTVRGDTVAVYRMGDWPAELGIVLVADALSAAMLCLTAAVAFPALWHATRGWDTRGRHFHALFHFQLMGLTGAFQTGDLFNLFVCFELMLIASYALLAHGGGVARLRAGVSYVVLNLIGSALFLVAVSLLYRVAGTLNLADLGVALASAGPADLPWIQAGALLLTAVFLLKGAILPLSFWLPATYGSASPPVAAIFAVLTKVGGYAVLRITPAAFGATDAAAWIEAIVAPLALGTLALAACGAFAATTLTQLGAWLALGSSAAVFAGVGHFTEGSATGGVFYAVASTLSLAALFLLADQVAAARGTQWQDRLCRAPAPAGLGLLGTTFLVLAMAVAGLPPLAPFIAKVALLQGIGPSGWAWGVILGAALLNIVALARAGSRLFWSAERAPCSGDPRAGSVAALLPVITILVAVGGLTVFAGPVGRYLEHAAHGAVLPGAYTEGVLGADKLRWSVLVRTPVAPALPEARP